LNWPDETLNKRDQLLRLAVEGVICPEVYDGPGVGRIGRSFKHQCASDLLHNTGRDYYTQKLPFTHEVRIHIFQGLAIHSGLKVKRDDIAHEWIRSSASGWKLDYSKAGSIKQSRRDLAKQAVAALDLDFGAVDIGIVQNGAAAVIEVNTAPGVEGSTIDAYVRHIIRVYEGGR
jgi:hypothetical protein